MYLFWLVLVTWYIRSRNSSFSANARPKRDASARQRRGEYTPERKGYGNGSYTPDLVTKTGRIEDLSVPRHRAGQFHTQVFER